MRDKIKGIALLFAMSMILGGNAVMASQLGHVYDAAGLLTESETEEVNTQIDAIQESSGWNIYAVTTADAGGKSAAAYADDFFDFYSSEQEDGVVTLIDMDNREITISTSGEAIRYLTDERIETILDAAYPDVSEGAYGDCLMSMLAGIEQAYDGGIPDGQYNYDIETGEISRYHRITWAEAVVALLLAIGTGIVIYAVVIGKYKLHFNTYQYNFRENSRVKLRIKEDCFVNQTTIHRPIPRPVNDGGGSSGRSSTHKSSSGRTHGGGSRKF